MNEKAKGAESPDHDLIIKHSVKIDNLCKLVKLVDIKLDKHHDKMDERCEKRRTEFTEQIDNSLEDVMSKDTIKWVLGIMILVMIAVSGSVGFNQVKIQKNEGRFDECLIQIKDNQKTIKNMQKILNIKMKILTGSHERLHELPEVFSDNK
jgi:hypothetical protein